MLNKIIKDVDHTKYKYNDTWLVIDNNNLIIATFDNEDDAIYTAIQLTPLDEVCYSVLKACNVII